MGTPKKDFNVVVDTGSDELWVTAFNCSECGDKAGNGFNPSDSSTYQSMDSVGLIKYGKGFVEGFNGRDVVSFQGLKISSNILFTDYEEEMDSQGIMGLGNKKRIPNIFDIAYQNHELVSPTFGF